MKEKKASTWVKVLIRLLATGFYTGLSPIAPGTFGSILAVFIIFFLKDFSTVHYSLLTGLVFGLAVFICYQSHAKSLFERKDAPQIVIDEIAGMMVTMIGIPITKYWLIVGLILFRFFDIVKVAPANWIDSKLKNGWGVVLDDIIAGIYSNLILHLILNTSLD